MNDGSFGWPYEFQEPTSFDALGFGHNQST